MAEQLMTHLAANSAVLAVAEAAEHAWFLVPRMFRSGGIPGRPRPPLA